MPKVVQLNNSPDAKVLAVFERAIEQIRNEHYSGAACILVRDDGAVSVTTCGKNRILLLGALFDLAFTMARDGDAP